MVKQGDSLLDAERPFSTHRISIKPNQKRWWPKTIYHTYWSRLSLWIHRNLLLFFIGLAIVSFATYIIFANSQPASRISHSDSSILKDLKGRFSDPFLFSYAPHQEKLRPSASDEFLAPDTQLNWGSVSSSNSTLKVKAAFVALVQEEDIYKLRLTMQDIERRFNHQKGYPWVIISDKILSRRFREWITSSTVSPVSFGQAPAVEWQEPYWVDIKKAESNMQDMVKRLNSDSIESMSWRRMTRYYCLFVFFSPLIRTRILKLFFFQIQCRVYCSSPLVKRSRVLLESTSWIKIYL
jgi:hypothetical protein